MRAMVARVNDKAAFRAEMNEEMGLVEVEELKEFMDDVHECQECYDDWLYFGGPYEGFGPLSQYRMALELLKRQRAA